MWQFWICLNVVKHASFDRKYEGIAKFPAVNRDISMVVPKEIMVGQIEHMIAQRGGKILEHFELFDIYEGDQIERRIQVRCLFSDFPLQRENSRRSRNQWRYEQDPEWSGRHGNPA